MLNQKLYRRNPAQLSKVAGQTIDSRWRQLEELATKHEIPLELMGLTGIDAMRLAFSDQFHGDRVFALMAGLCSMLGESYGFKEEFYWLDSLDQQKLYNSARNIEVLMWLLRTRLNEKGQPLILTNSSEAESVNLSFERTFGKLIAHQDMLATIVSYKTQRTINSVAQSIVSMSFIPL